ncbi:unnamed protein product [Somion occarium]|uniref:DNA 3'-5' helicase n=1 Tax=Somion occarium TaxID=3059160 RepID=A0ABP1D9Z6_9APHY
MQYSHLQDLNQAQLRAVEHDPNIPLQILAGPGSGKTKVLTTRIAHLISQRSIEPSSICAVTFTNKAANEMRERLSKLIGMETTSLIRMGTFHALCAMFLRRHANLVKLNGNFTVCDSDESKKIVSKLLKAHRVKLATKAITLREEAVLSLISKAKSKGHSPDDVLDMLEDPSKRRKAQKKADIGSISALIDQTIATLYRDYERTLRDNNSLDFDDLLIYGVRLFRDHRKVGKWCKHILVDEFQDTNTMQYELMQHIAAANRCVTIVGDPDQSIYGWRSAEVENLQRMRQDFPSTIQILLEHNYRSTGSILAASVAIVAQDKSRIPKTLHTQHAIGPNPTLQAFPSEYEEATFIATEIKRLLAATGDMLKWSDFAVLLRYNSLSRAIESALQQQGIPNRVLGGHKFFERSEVKDILAYMQVIDNPQFIPAFSRAVNTPSRGIGEKTISEMLTRAATLNLSPLEVAERIYDEQMPDIKPPVRRKLKSFIEPIKNLRKLANNGELPSNLIRTLLDLIHYENHLKKTQPDADSRWDNVQELINFAREFEVNESSNLQLPESPLPGERVAGENDWEDHPDEFDHNAFDEDGIAEIKPGANSKLASHRDTPLRLFLQASMLSTDVQTQDSRADNNVTITTCHAAKGLEWPVVFVPAVEKGTFPSSRAEDVEEERRLLYVACTRAQGLLYLSHSTGRMVSGETKPQEISEFIWVVKRSTPGLFSATPPNLSREDRTLLASVLHRDAPDEAKVSQRLEEHYRTAGQTSWSSRPGGSTNRYRQPPSTSNFMPNSDAALTSTSYQAAFASAKSYQSGTDQVYPVPRAPLSPSRSSVVNAAPRQIVSNKPHSKAMSSNIAASSTAIPSTTQKSALPKQGTLASFVKPLSSSSSSSLLKPTSKSTPDQFPSTSFSAGSSSLSVPTASAPGKVAGVKRRLGMGHGAIGYSNKKYKPPT